MFIMLIVFIFAATGHGLRKQDEVNCAKWSEYARKYPGFYITEIQDKQCKTLGFKIETKIQ